MKFIEPPEGGLPGNYTGNSQYAIGEKIEISWVEGNMAQQYNLVMFQNWNSNSEIIQSRVIISLLLLPHFSHTP